MLDHVMMQPKTKSGDSIKPAMATTPAATEPSQHVSRFQPFFVDKVCVFWLPMWPVLTELMQSNSTCQWHLYDVGKVYSTAQSTKA
jgi:hypothetical protein